MEIYFVAIKQPNIGEIVVDTIVSGLAVEEGCGVYPGLGRHGRCRYSDSS